MSRDPQSLLFDPSSSRDPPALLREPAVRSDLALLLYALNYAYPGSWAMHPELWAHTLQGIAALPANVSISPHELGTRIADLLWQIPDGHLKVRLQGETLGTELRKHARRRRPNTGENIAHGHVWRLVEVRGVPVLGITTFPQSSEPIWDGFLDEVKRLREAEYVIVDLRGNNGGDDHKAMEMMCLWLDAEFQVDWVREIECESAEAYALQVNTYRRILWNNYGAKGLAPPPALEEKQASLEAQLARLRHCAPTRAVREPSSRQGPLGAQALRGKIFGLIDAATQSSGEWTALFLKRHPHAQLVGENTYGMVHFGNTGALRLPQSGLMVSLCMKINEFTDGHFYEKTGVAPDHRTEQDSLAHVLNNFCGR